MVVRPASPNPSGAAPESHEASLNEVWRQLEDGAVELA